MVTGVQTCVFRSIDGELDHLPEACFNLKGTIEEAIEAGEKMLAENA